MTEPIEQPQPGPGMPPPAPTATIPPIPPSPAGQTPQAQPSVSFWESLAGLGVRRDRSRGWVGGVCVGIGDRLGVDALLIRALAVLLLFTGGVGLIVYLAAWLLLPDTNGTIMLREAGRGSIGAIALVVALAIVLMSGLSFSDGPFWMGGWLLPVLVIMLFALWYANRGSTGARPTHVGSDAGQGSAAYATQPPSATPTPYATQATYAGPPAYGMTPPPVGPSDPTAGESVSTTYAPAIPTVPTDTAMPPAVPPVPPRPMAPPRTRRRRAPRGIGAVVAGLAVLGYGLGFLLDGPVDFNGSGHFLGLLIALGLTSLAALVLGLSGRRGGIASVLSLLLLVPVGVTAIVHKGGDFGPRGEDFVTWTPTSNATFDHPAGEATLDLSQITSGDTVDLAASVGAGKLTILVPQDAEVDLNASVGLGSVDLGRFGKDTGGFGPQVMTVIDPNGADESPVKISLRANVGLGELVLQEK